MSKTERARQAILGALVADAAAMGLHWIYDVDRVAELGGAEPEFHPPVDYHQKRSPGGYTHYGDHLLVALESIAESGGLDVEDYRGRYKQRFSADYDGYVDHATKDLLETGRGADDNQAGALTKLVAYTVRYLEDPEFEARIEESIRATHENEQAVRYGVAAACAIREAIRGSDARASVEAACRTSGAVNKQLEEVLAAEDDVIAYALQRGQTCPVPNSVPVAFHAALHGDSFEESVRASILSGGDTSGRLMVTGAIRGATDGVPDAWLAKLGDRAQAEALADRVVAAAGLS
ncbi:MAG: ADP-ribosylglycohydrolase family protein [Planctomycetota bacterium]